MLDEITYNEKFIHLAANDSESLLYQLAVRLEQRVWQPGLDS